MENGKHIGLVMWWSDRDGNGIILGIDKKEYYFDRSVLLNEVNRGDRVLFSISKKITYCLCAYGVVK